MQIVISPERALADGISPQELIVVAQWHEERATLIDQSMKKSKRKPMGNDFDIARHDEIAAELRAVARAMQVAA